MTDVARPILNAVSLCAGVGMLDEGVRPMKPIPGYAFSIPAKLDREPGRLTGSSQMDDKTLLELAAKAAGYEVSRESDTGRGLLLTGVQHVWNPLTDDGDALRLAVKLGITIDTGDGVHVQYIARGVAYPITEYEFGDIYAATRRAIVRAAAELGKSK